jgi:apolipoprotein N-acyltransferase
MLTGSSDDAAAKAAGPANTHAAGPPAETTDQRGGGPPKATANPQAGGSPAESGRIPAAPAPAPAAPAGPGAGPRVPAGRDALRTRTALAVALVGGLALAAAFPPAGVWPLAVAGPALLTVALWRRSLRGSLAVGLVFGAAFFLPMLTWMINVAWYVFAALAGGEALIFAVTAVTLRLMLNLRAWPAAVALWWVADEALRNRWPFGGFGWGRLAMSQAGKPAAEWVAFGGVPWLTFLVAACAAALAWLLIDPRRPGRGGLRGLRNWRPRIAPAVALATALGVTLGGALLPARPPGRGASTATVAAIQGNVPHASSLAGVLRATTVTANHAEATEKLARQVAAGQRPAPDLVIWPENSTDIDPSLYPPVYGRISAAVRAINRPVLVGAVLDNPVRNAGQLWLPGRGPVATYVKRKLVPFGEVIPFRGILSRFISLIKYQPRDFTPGHRAVVFQVGRIRLGDVICYEVSFDDLVQSEVSLGANLLAVQTNDASFEVDGQTGETLQQLDMARIRAVEFDRTVVVASTSGVSAIVNPDGSLTQVTGTWVQAELDAKVSLRTYRTLASRIGDGPEYVLTLMALAALAWALFRTLAARRGRRDP